MCCVNCCFIWVDLGNFFDANDKIASKFSLNGNAKSEDIDKSFRQWTVNCRRNCRNLLELMEQFVKLFHRE